MKYKRIPSELFVKNRKKFAEKMQSGSLAVFNSNDILPTNADGHLPFRQNNDIFYLSGVDQEESILVLFPDSFEDKHKEILFLRETNENIAIWEGAKLDKKDAFEVSGIKTVYWLQEFEKVFKTLAFEAKGIYLNANEHLRADTTVQTRENRFSEWCRKEFPIHQYYRAAPIMHQLRSVKENEEIELMQNACNITAKAVDRILKYIKPGVMEYEIEAEIMHEFMRNRSRGFAYEPIIASGLSACVLHYVENNRECKDGDLILMDFGAEYANYASDLTRTVPVNGKFSDRQKEVYSAVLRVMKKAMALLKPGVYLTEYHKEVGHLMEEELVNLGLLTRDEIKDQNPNWPAYKKFFMHGTSHYIGLDVHDVGSWTEPIQEGMVFTVEPGIYIREENIGIRLENDILITKDGYTDLMEDIPLEIEEIEAAMN